MSSQNKPYVSLKQSSFCKSQLFVTPFTIYEINTSPANIYLFKFNNRNTRKRCKICSKLTIKTLERRQ